MQVKTAIFLTWEGRKTNTAKKYGSNNEDDGERTTGGFL